MEGLKIKCCYSTSLLIENDFIVWDDIGIAQFVPEDIIIAANIKCFQLNVFLCGPRKYGMPGQWLLHNQHYQSRVASCSYLLYHGIICSVIAYWKV